jgi:hypothetical protein
MFWNNAPGHEDEDVVDEHPINAFGGILLNKNHKNSKPRKVYRMNLLFVLLF